MSAKSLAQLLERLQGGLEGLLSCLEAQPLPDAPVLDTVWAEVHRDFEEVRHRLGALGDGHPENESAREQIEHCLRLQAVATGVLVRRREELVVERAACSTARQRLARRAQASGGSCDVRG